MTNDCVFCKIIAGQIPADKVYEDDKILAFLDINPVNFGHTLIIPKAHHQMMPDTPDDLVGYVFTKAKHLMVAIKHAMAVDYVVISVVGIEVPHFHVHLVPRDLDDGLAKFWPTKKYDIDQAKDVVTKIKNSL